MDIENKRAFLIRALYALTWVGIGYILLKYLLPQVTPFLSALVIAYLLNRPILYMQQKWNLRRSLSACLVVSVFYGLIGALVCLLGIRVVGMLSTMLGNLPEVYAEYAEPWLVESLNGTKALLRQADESLLGGLEQIGEQVLIGAGELVSTVSVWAMGILSGASLKLPKLFVELMLMIIATFFIAIDYEKLKQFCSEKLDKKAGKMLFALKAYVTGTLFVCLKAYVLIMTITFVELSIGFMVIGIERALWIAGIIAVFDILPVLGTGGIMLPWAVIGILQGKYRLAISLLLLYLVITIVRNIVEPKIVDAKLGLHPVITLISMYVGTQLLGIIGLFGGPILLSMLQYLQSEGYFQSETAGYRVKSNDLTHF